MWHDPGNHAGVLAPGGFVQPGQHVESAESKRRFKNLLDATGTTARLRPIAPRAASTEELLRVHTLRYVEHVMQLSRTGGDVGLQARLGPGGFEIAALAAGGVIAAVDAVLDGTVGQAYALVRPPGHHAEPDGCGGFCVFSNAAIAGRHALAARGLPRIAFVDWDVHHGNGTQAAFYDDPSALTVSLHQDRLFPRTSGGIDEIGAGAGTGYNLNVPLPPGCAWPAYAYAFERIVLPALEAFRPQLIIVPCGFDAGINDPLGRMMLTPEAFRSMTALIRDAAGRLCDGRLVLCHEGGYCAATVPFLGLAVIEALLGHRSDVCDVVQTRADGLPWQHLQAHQRAAVDAAHAAAASLPWWTGARAAT
ncbi:MAG: class II histone deacetylase [Burkholderiales bacterium]|nr:MAG: class II histone deacetylase [Burkholderiales bacterium]